MKSLTRLTLHLLFLIVFAAILGGCGDTKPNTPSGLTAVDGDGKVTVSWNSVTSTTYKIYWSSTSGGTKTSPTIIDPATSPQVVTGLTNGTTYYFAVIAKNSEGESALSSEVSATPTAAAVPAAPTGVGVLAGTGKATVSWTAVSGATSYYVYYSSTLANATKANGVRFSPATASPQDVTGLTPGVWYFVVTAVNASGESVESSPAVSATVL